MVEDSPVGVAAGVAAGMMVIGFAGDSRAGSHLDQAADQLRARDVARRLRVGALCC